MTLTLDPALEQRLQQELAKGGYDDPAAFIAHALDEAEAKRSATEPVPQEMEDWLIRNKEAVNRALDESFAQAERGEFYTPEEAQAMLAQRRAERASRAA
jgi:predicted transcriptional regulator